MDGNIGKAGMGRCFTEGRRVDGNDQLRANYNDPPPKMCESIKE